jgi:hypothetical protein
MSEDMTAALYTIQSVVAMPVGAPLTSAAVGSANFVGTSASFVKLQQSESLTFAGDFSVQAWVKRSFAGAKDIILSQGSCTANPGESVEIGFQADNSFMLSFGDTDKLTTTTTYEAETNWVHWTATYAKESGTRGLYLNGVIVGLTDTTTTVVISAGEITIAGSADCAPSVQKFLSAYLDEMRVWTRSLPLAKIAAEFTIQQHTDIGLVASLTFDEATNLPADYSMYSNTGMVGAAVFPGAEAMGPNVPPTGIQKVDFSMGSADFLGTTDFANTMTLPTEPRLSLRGSFTMQVWLNRHRSTYDDIAISRGGEQVISTPTVGQGAAYDSNKATAKTVASGIETLIFTYPTALLGYRMTAADDSKPAGWVWQARSGANWTTLHTVSATPFSSLHSEKTFTSSNNIAFDEYRWVFNEETPGVWNVKIAELEVITQNIDVAESIHIGYHVDNSFNFEVQGRPFSFPGYGQDQNLWTHWTAIFDSETHMRKLYRAWLLLGDVTDPKTSRFKKETAYVPVYTFTFTCFVFASPLPIVPTH